LCFWRFPKLRVAGSNPLSRSRFRKRPRSLAPGLLSFGGIAGCARGRILGRLGPGDIWSQGLANDECPSRVPVQATAATSDDRFDDTSGGFIAYAALGGTLSSDEIVWTRYIERNTP
jgi:hypothetical protein